METTTTTPAPRSANTFAPLPSGDPPPPISPERVREELGWGLLHANWR